MIRVKQTPASNDVGFFPREKRGFLARVEERAATQPIDHDRNDKPYREGGKDRNDKPTARVAETLCNFDPSARVIEALP
jgi:hypothetical protein